MINVLLHAQKFILVVGNLEFFVWAKRFSLKLKVTKKNVNFLNKNGFILILVWLKLKQLLLMTEWEFDSSSGYHYNQSNSLYYDPNSGFYYSDAIGTEFFFLIFIRSYFIPFLSILVLLYGITVYFT